MSSKAGTMPAFIIDLNQLNRSGTEHNTEIKKNNCHNLVFFFNCLFYEVNLQSSDFKEQFLNS